MSLGCGLEPLGGNQQDLLYGKCHTSCFSVAVSTWPTGSTVGGGLALAQGLCRWFIKSIMVGKAWQSALCVSEAADDMSPQGGGREGIGSESKLWTSRSALSDALPPVSLRILGFHNLRKKDYLLRMRAQAEDPAGSHGWGRALTQISSLNFNTIGESQRGRIHGSAWLS